MRTAGHDQFEKDVLANIKTYGWHCQHILEEGDHAPWTFSIGLHSTYQHPEIIIVGLSGEAAHKIINSVVTLIEAGNPPSLHAPNDNIVSGYTFEFVRVPKTHYPFYVGTAIWYYEGQDFPLIQCVWPSKENILPWDVRAPQSFKEWQLVLST